MPDSDLRVALVLNQFLGWSQNFITRELVQLAEEGVDLRIFAREIHERDDLADDERRCSPTRSSCRRTRWRPAPSRATPNSP
jgi:hypothetical protein